MRSTVSAAKIPMVDAKLLFSMVGGDVWADYQRGVNPVLLLDLHAATIDADALVVGVAARLLQVSREERFGSVAMLVDFVAERMHPFRRRQPEQWRHQDKLHYPTLYKMLGLSVEDPAAVTIKHFVRVLVEAAYGGVHTRRKYAARMSVIWFEICDVAAVDPAPVT